ncbi:MAG: single-stranded-DNA-specific exonuclease RecJ [Planctomycetota bacterium]
MSPTTLTSPPWRLRRADIDAARAVARAHGVSDLIGRLLALRGHTDPERAWAHLEPRLSALHEPALLPNMPAATERIARAIAAHETILVHGDYDVDGVTGTALLVRLFEKLGARVAWHIPNRFTDGYSFGSHSVERARNAGATLVISVDNGTSSAETIAELSRHGIDTVVTDHHEPPNGPLPAAAAIVNPKLTGSSYPFRELCGGAVAFKLAWGVCQEQSGGGKVREEMREFLVDAMAYVAIATVCDVVPLVDENRVLARFGLRSLEMTKNPGLKALLSIAKLAGNRLDADDVAFQVGPRINASGRLGSAQKAVELLLAKDTATAVALALELDRLNVQRKQIEAELLSRALIAAEPYSDREQHPVLVVAGQGWHQGVVGIVAARLAQRFERPAVVIGLDGETGRGSARSVVGFSVLEALHGGAPHMLRYGGHEQAAGCEVRADAIDALRDAVCARAREITEKTPGERRELWIDADLPLRDMNPSLMREIDRLKPFGEGNARPVFASTDLRLAEEPRIVGGDATHMMLQLRQGAAVLRGMAFGMAKRASELKMGEPVHAAYSPKWNSFRGTTNLEIEVVDFRTGERPAL